jgi:hypothetical protein
MPQSSEIPTQALRSGLSGSMAGEATPPSDEAPWFSRIKAAATVRDPNATVSYIVAREGDKSPTVGVAPESLARVRQEFTTGTVLEERYRLIRELGRGGMGIVFLGRDQRLDRQVALKVILAPGHASSSSPSMDSRLRASFAEEARLGASLTHPAVATVFDYGFHHDSPFTVFEYIKGETLRELLERRGRLPLDEVRLIIGPLAQALDFAHGRRIVHRDLKPENVRATEQRQFKILDLGLAREFNRQEDWRFAGTPAYAAPEQAGELPSDGRADQYALGVIVFEMLTGRRPFESDSWAELLQMHYSDPPLRPRTLVPDLPQPVEDAILRSLEKDPNRRFSTCSEFAVALGCQFLAGPVPLPEILLETEVRKMGGRWKSYFYPFSNFWRPRAQLALAPDAVVGMFRAELMRWPLAALYDLQTAGPRKLSFRLRGAKGKDCQWFKFKNRKELCKWRDLLEQRITAAKQAADIGREAPGSPETGPDYTNDSSIFDPRIEPVVLLERRPGTRFQLLGMVEAKARSRRAAAAGLAIRGSMMGADAVVDLHRERLPSFARTEHRASGIAVRAVDEEGRIELKRRWFSSQIGNVAIIMLVIEVLELLTDLSAGAEVHSLTGYLNIAGALFFVSLVAGLTFWKWPQLVRPAAFGFLAKAVYSALKPLSSTIGAAIGGYSVYTAMSSSMLGDANRIAFMIGTVFGTAAVLVFGTLISVSIAVFFLYLARRAYRVEQEYRGMLDERQRSTMPRFRRWAGHLAWAGMIFYAALLVVDTALEVRTTLDGLRALPASNAAIAAAVRSASRADAEMWNTRAWTLATDSDPAARNSTEALKLAEQAVVAQPDVATYASTLGVARYRAGNFQGSLEALNRSVVGQGFNAGDGFFLAMAHARLGHHGEAQSWYARADRWMREKSSDDDELQRFRAEAATLLELIREDALAPGLSRSTEAPDKKDARSRKAAGMPKTK